MRFTRYMGMLSGLTVIFAGMGIFADVTVDNFERVFNGNDIGTPWYFYNDASSSGNSRINNMGPENTFAGGYGPGNASTYAGVMDFTLGSAYDYPYVGMGFSLCNDNGAPVNMTGATSIQFDIKASRSMSVRVEVDQSTIVDNDYYNKTVSVGTSWTTVTVNLSTGTGNLHQDGWGDAVAFAKDKLTRINWVCQDYANGASGTISIDNVVFIGDPVGLLAPPPYPPILSLPSWKAVDVSPAPSLFWHPSTGATGYRLQIATSDTFKTCFLDEPNNADTTRAVTGLAHGTPYYWRVKAYSGADTGRWSSTGMFTTLYDIPPVPTLTTPVDAATAVPVSTTLAWAAAVGATTYNLQVSASSSFASYIFDLTGLTAVAYATATLDYGAAYYWHVSATNLSGTSAWSPTRSFTTVQAPPAVPTLVSPVSGAADVAMSVPFIWNAAARAASYTLQVSTSSTFGSFIINQTGLIDTTFTGATLNSATRYYWRIQATGSDGGSSVSAVWSFTTLTIIPGVPSLITPADGAVNIPVSTTVTWGAVAGAASYALEVSTSSSFTPAVVSRTGIVAASYSLTALSNSTVYYLRVRATNTAGSSDWSIVRSFTTAAPPPATTRMTCFGFYTNGSKRIVVKDAPDSLFQIRDSAGTVVFTGTLGAPSLWAPSGETVRIADFSSLKTIGTGSLYLNNVKASGGDFIISPQPLRALSIATLKAYYYQRSSTPLPAAYAGTWARAAGHPDTAVIVHSSAGSGTISSPKGWYDAGDYGKYIINSGITVYTLLALYEHFPAFMSSLSLTIPESNNTVPDILDEVRWNLDWMLTMQASDGGVYSKLTPLQFDGFIMPDQSIANRYVFMKTTPAALDFAAVMALSSRLYSPFDGTFAAQCLEAAKKAYAWAIENPSVKYVQPSTCNTGEYGDEVFSDEFFWASAELARATRSSEYTRHLVSPTPSGAIPIWPNVSTLGLYTILTNMQAFPTRLVDTARAHILYTADYLLLRQQSGYGISMDSNDFYWGSNHVAASQGVLLLYAYYLTGKNKYLTAAEQQMDYLTGKNPFGRCFITGLGRLPPLHPHHRISDADGISAPVPGFLVGGPNPNREDSVSCGAYGGKPAFSWLDDVCSYATNEVAINWNAPLAYCASALEAVHRGDTVRGFRIVSTGEASEEYARVRNNRITLSAGKYCFVFQSPAPAGATEQGVFRMYNASGKRLMQLSAKIVSFSGENYYSVRVPSGGIATGYVIAFMDAGGKRLQRSFVLH
jgi:endoglucanase